MPGLRRAWREAYEEQAEPSWIARLDTRSTRWPAFARWTYLICKWSLILLGAFALGGVWGDRLGLWSIY